MFLKNDSIFTIGKARVNLSYIGCSGENSGGFYRSKNFSIIYQTMGEQFYEVCVIISS